MRRKPELMAMLVLAALPGCSVVEPAGRIPAAQPAFYASLASPSARVDAAAARDLINNYRRTQGLQPVVIDPQLMDFAQRQAATMASAATSDATRGSPPASRLRGTGIIAGTASENASAGYHTISDAFSGWRGSPRHDATFRMPAARRMGIATAYNPASRHKVYWTLVMAD